MSDKLKEACGVVGAYLPNESVATYLFYGLFALQHRGQESAGIATCDNGDFHLVTGMGLVSQVFDQNSLMSLPGKLGIGQTRYSTTGNSTHRNAQPIIVSGPDGKIALAHNGNLANGGTIRSDLQSRNFVFGTDTDSEAIALMLAYSSGSWPKRFAEVMKRLVGSYSLTIMTGDKIFGVRDPLGNRPLCLGKFGNGWVIASETCALDHIGATDVRDIKAGEVVQIDQNGVTSFFPMGESKKEAYCSFESIYFARPDLVFNGQLTYLQRVRLGEQLAYEHPVTADIVISVPDSSVPAAQGYADVAKLPLRDGLVKNRYVGRTFIQPTQALRDQGVRLKLNYLKQVLGGKRVIVVDDSIVRGTTTPHVVSLVRLAGATEVHLRITAPPVRHPCHYGVDMATRNELIAHNLTVEEICRYIGADSLGYLSEEGLLKALRLPTNRVCTACFNGEYPTSVQQQLELGEKSRLQPESDLEPELAFLI